MAWASSLWGSHRIGDQKLEFQLGTRVQSHCVALLLTCICAGLLESDARPVIPLLSQLF